MQDLERADVSNALAIFVMSNKHAKDIVEEDTKTLMNVLAISQFLRQKSGAGAPRVCR